ncbi:leucokinin [Teleopsis dalmanni]|uniref:leucokinin n=1 Tax=Teleopsis dalmanni TaxID=139649 RepID=UPI0018CFD06F|nr:leucokinin [Teleopsis dalmanni]
MLAPKILLLVALIWFYKQFAAKANILNRASPGLSATDELNTCEEQLSKYRKFLLQAIISFEDVCDAYNAHPVTMESHVFQGVGNAGRTTREGDDLLVSPIFLHNYQPPEQRSEIWAFFKLLMAQFNDVEFTNVIREAVIERCHIKSQRDEKRNSVVLGKKQRFHSWGGKRSQLLSPGSDEHNGDQMYLT